MVSPETLARIEASRERHNGALERDAEHMDTLYWANVYPSCPSCSTAPAYRVKRNDPWDTHYCCPSCGYCYTHGH